MILYQGKVYENNMKDMLLHSIYEDCLKILSSQNELNINLVVNACDKLYKKILNHEFDNIILPILKTYDIDTSYYNESIKMFSKESLLKRVEIELNKDYQNLSNINNTIKRKYAPLGILLHNSAGNVDILPFYSVIEGLLTQNINILKLPTGDDGVSIKLLSELIKIEPLLKDYIYVFDIPSKESESIKKLMDISNAIIVWGGDEVNKAIRINAPINSKIISWGHKLSFAYISKGYDKDELYNLALSICKSNQTLCSSVQGIYFDTDKDDELLSFSKDFFELFKKANSEVGNNNLSMNAKNTFTLYSKSLEEDNNDVIFNENGVSVVVKNSSELELSLMFKNVWIKKLDRNDIVKVLHKNKDYLQTVALLSNKNDKDELSNLLIKAGVTRITKGNPSRVFLGESHDGEYALRRYLKIVEID